ncbi:SH3 domain-containing protein [Evansella clarkii]|uniref:SH3 domain-containing protein n=1 Tax=Evansella clarkii TaxID=79879 RepID=UPI000B430762|nr:SH3 domain-containing protein [Evansella clarkii]
MNKSKVLKVIKQHKTNYPDPISLHKGQTVHTGKLYEGEEDWDNWIYCFTEDKSSEGWVPAQIIRSKSGTGRGVILEDYCANELTVEKGEELIVYKELNGWYWTKRQLTGEEGWVPKSHLEERQG